MPISDLCTGDPRRGARADSLLALLPSKIRTFAALAAETHGGVLLDGETGSGKTHLARLIHQLSPRAGKPFVEINCASIPENLFEREMFGHVRGAFTDAKESRAGIFETAHGGTLFLDEIGELPLPVQPKLLCALEEGLIRRLGSVRPIATDVRIITATNRNLHEMIEQKQFRQDLYYRINVMEHHVPPLRDRRGDLPTLIRHLLTRNAPHGSHPPALSAEALEILRFYRWPGNIRELDNALRQAVVYSRGSTIEPQHLPGSCAPGFEPVAKLISAKTIREDSLLV